SRWLFELGALIDRQGLVLSALLAAACAGLVHAWRRGALALMLGQALLRIPFIGARVGAYRLTRFYRTTSMPLRGGVPLVSALEMVAGLLDPTSRVRLAAATRRVREGGPLSAALESNLLSTPVVARMLQV